MVYVTKHWTMPREVLERMVAEVESKRGDSSMRAALFWLSWRTLPHVLDGLPTVDITAGRVRAHVTGYLSWLGLRFFAGAVAPSADPQPTWGYVRGVR